MSVSIYGIRNCDTLKKARAWLDAKGVAYRFHDYKVEGIDRQQLVAWCQELGWEKVLNRAGTTFRALPESDKTTLTEAKAMALMLAAAGVIKRPILDTGKKRLAGFRPAEHAAAFA